MPFRDPRRHLEDVLDAIDKIEEFIGEMDLNAYRTDDKTKAAVERKIQVLTEASIRLEDESPWKMNRREHIPKSIKEGIVVWAIYFGIPTIVWTTS